MTGETMHRVIEVARLLGVSKVTIYKKMELLKKELKPHIRYRSNIAYIEEPGVTILRQSLSIPSSEEHSMEPQEDNESLSKADLEGAVKASQAMVLQAYDLHCSDLLQHLESLNHMIKVRKDEIERKEQQLKSLQRLVKWNKSSGAFVEKIHEAWERMSE